MEIQQMRVGSLAVFCYLVGDESSGTCALIDPAFEVGKILAAAERRGYRVTQVINTHSHSDHTAGNASVLEATGARLLVHRLDAEALTGIKSRAFSRVLGGKGSPEADVLLEDGDVVEVGETSLEVIHTPGHSPGGICLYSAGHVFTGDTLFVGGVGRTDIAGGSMRQLMASIRERIYTLPGETVIWPGHDYGMHPHSTVEREKQTNPFTSGVIVD